MQSLWQEAASKHSEFHRHQWITILALLYGTGLRRGEIERLNLDQFDRTEGTLRIDGRKTGRERCVPVPPILWRCLESYLPQRHNVSSVPVRWVNSFAREPARRAPQRTDDQQRYPHPRAPSEGGDS